MAPSWLPATLTFNGGRVSDDYEKLYSVFKQDFIDSDPVVVEGDRVVYNFEADPASGGRYPYGFTHLVTIGKGARGIDYDRAPKLPWVRPILVHYKEPEISAFWAPHPEGRTLYLWLTNYDFVVMLRELQSDRERSASDKKIIVTSYHVWPSMRRRFSKLYDQSSEKIL